MTKTALPAIQRNAVIEWTTPALIGQRASKGPFSPPQSKSAGANIFNQKTVVHRRDEGYADYRKHEQVQRFNRGQFTDPTQSTVIFRRIVRQDHLRPSRLLTWPQVQAMIGQLLNGILKCDSCARIRRRMERNERARRYHWKSRNRLLPRRFNRRLSRRQYELEDRLSLWCPDPWAFIRQKDLPRSADHRILGQAHSDFDVTRLNRAFSMVIGNFCPDRFTFVKTS
jgi:hypothetical protein